MAEAPSNDTPDAVSGQALVTGEANAVLPYRQPFWRRGLDLVTNLPGWQGVAAGAMVLMLSLAAGFGVHHAVGRAHTTLESLLARDDGSRRSVTSVAWLSADELAVGTNDGMRLDYSLASGAGTLKGRGPWPIVGMLRADPTSDDVMTLEIEPSLSNGETSITGLRQDWLHSDQGNYVRAEGRLFAIGIDSPAKLLSEREAEPVVGRQISLAEYRLNADGTLTDDKFEDVVEDARAIATMPDRSRAIVGTGDGTAYVVDLSTQGSANSGATQLQPAPEPASPIVAVAAGGLPGDAVLASAALDGRVLVYPGRAINEGEQIVFDAPVEVGLAPEQWSERRLDGTWRKLVTISDDGSEILVLGADGQGYLLARDGPDPRSGGVSTPNVDSINMSGATIDMVLSQGKWRNLPSVAGNIFSSTLEGVAVDRADNFAASWGSDGEIRLLSAEKTDVVALDTLPTRPAAVAFSPGGSLLAAITAKGGLTLYDTRERRRIASTEDFAVPTGSGPTVTALAFSSDGKRLVATLVNGSFRLYSSRSLRWIEDERLPEPLPITRSGRHLARFGDRYARMVNDEAVEIVDTRTGQTLSRVTLASTIDQVLLSGDGNTLAILDTKGELTIATTGSPGELGNAGPLVVMDQAARDGLKLSVAGNMLLLRTREGKFFVAGVRSTTSEGGGIVAEEIAVDEPATLAEISHDGSFVVVAGADNSLRLIDISGTPGAPDFQTQVFDLPEHGGIVNQLAISPDGSHVVAASIDGRISLIDIARARLVGALPLARVAAHPASPTQIARRLDEGPGAFPDPPAAGPTVARIIVLGSHATLQEAQAEAEQAIAAGFATTIYLRQGLYRTAVAPAVGEANAVLRQVRQLSPSAAGAYIRQLEPWCPNTRAGDQGYVVCTERPPPSGAQLTIGGDGRQPS